ncbi:MAG: hypothetical protein IJ060_09690 [Oscillospiraceae bacterium]|nr:hypothetical protein [Oscillospiraceae bacterium]
MVCFRLRGITLLADFTAPALLCLLMLMQPQEAVLRLLGACILHESAHFFAAALTGRRPDTLRISASGLCLTLKQPALCPLPAYTAILLAGSGANLAAAAGFFAAGFPAAALVNLELGLFNLLPYRCTDGGTLLYLLLCRAAVRRSFRVQRVMCGISLLTSLLLAAAMLYCGAGSPALWAMLGYLSLSAAGA